MDLYNIPHDDGISYRKKAFMTLLKPMKYGYIDGATDYCLLIPFSKDKGLNEEQCIWLSYLYGLSYSCTTAIRLFQNFGSPLEISKKRLQKVWDEQKDSLYFNPDKKYIKNNNQVVPAINSLRKSIKNSLAQDLNDSIKRGGFELAYKEILKNWKFFGPHGAFLFFDAYTGLCGNSLDPIHLNWKTCGQTVVDGMSHFLYRDECVGTRDIDVKKYSSTVKLIQSKSGISKILIESTLCAFRKLFKHTRYFGYYADRNLEECLKVATYLPEVWNYRSRSIPKSLRGEDNGWRGIRPEKCFDWVNGGKFGE